jgi:hypothetical protein
MSKVITSLGTSIVAFGILIGGLEAKTVSYDINGQRYSYDTGNRKQAAAAQKQIEAAKIAEAAKTKAAAERANNPLVTIFGSQTQREAAEAQAQLEKIVSDQQQATAINKSQRPMSDTKDEGVQNVASAKTGELAAVNDREQTAALAIAPVETAAPRLSSPDQRKPAEPARSGEAPATAIKSISLDVETGIKTVIRTDGSIQEELFDPGILSKLASEHGSIGSVSTVAATDPQPKTAPEDMTGSTSFRGANLKPNSGPDLRSKSPPH